MKRHLLWCAAICLATCVHAFAGERQSYPASPETRPETGVRPALLDMDRNAGGASPLMAATSIGLLVPAHGSVSNARTSHALQGLFCNSAEQVDDAVTHMRKGTHPRAAVELLNREAIVCTYVDLLRYIVDHPVVIDEMPGSFPLFKHEGTLVGVAVGDAVRPVTPPVRIFFAIPERLADAPFEGRA